MQIICALNNKGTLRYNELRKKLGGISNTVLAASLRELEEKGLVERKEYLESIKDYESCIEIADLGTISLYYFNNKIYFPTLAFSVLEQLKKTFDISKCINT